MEYYVLSCLKVTMRGVWIKLASQMKDGRFAVYTVDDD